MPYALRLVLRRVYPTVFVLLAAVAATTAVGSWVRDDNESAAVGWGVVAALWLREWIRVVAPATNSEGGTDGDYLSDTPQGAVR